MILFNFKKGIGPVVAISLILVVTVISVVGFQGWFDNFTSKIFSDVEKDSFSNSLPKIDNIIGDNMYITSDVEGVSISSVNIGDVDCEINYVLKKGINNIDVGDCLDKISSDVSNVVVMTDNGIVDKEFFLDSEASFVELGKDCIFEDKTLKHGEGIRLFLNESPELPDICEFVVRYCNDGVLGGDGNYSFQSCGFSCKGNGLNGFEGGVGSSEDPYQICNCSQLQNVNVALTSNYELINDIDCSDTVNWDYGKGFNPLNIGDNIFDGNDFEINDLFINREDDNNIGLFGILSEFVNVKNIKMNNVTISGKDNVGGILGNDYYYYPEIDNVYVNGKVSGNENVGGLVGTGDYAKVENSYVDVEVIGNENVGGLVGSGKYATIDNSYSRGMIKGNKYIGGLIGNGNYAILKNNYVIGNVQGNEYFGGLIGNGNEPDIKSSYWATDIVGITSATSNFGVGKLSSELKAPSSNSGIYFIWNPLVWNFGNSNEYPIFRESKNNCYFNNNGLYNLESRRLYSIPLVSKGDSCENYMQIRTCDYGNLSGDNSYIYSTCIENVYEGMNSFLSNWSITDKKINLPLVSNGKYNFIVDWGDGKVSSVTNFLDNEHIYSSNGNYVVNITGVIEGFAFNYMEGSNEFIDVSSWGSLKLGNNGGYFAGCSNFVGSKISSLNISDITNMNEMFTGDKLFNNDISGWNTSSVTNMSYMFSGAKIFNQDISEWNTGSVTNMEFMFNGAEYFNQNISKWNTSKVLNMSYMFSGAAIFNQDISEWDTSSVTDMTTMFFMAKKFNQDISEWNTSSVKNMNHMFYNAELFNQNLSKWDTSSVTDMGTMFANTLTFNNDISEWNTSSVTDMNHMFSNTQKFNQNISEWDISSVTDMTAMFFMAKKFNNNISKWNTSSVRSMDGMFLATYEFNIDISGWDTSSLVDMERMFSNTQKFNQNLSKWNTSSVRYYNNYDRDAIVWQENYKPNFSMPSEVKEGST